MNCLEGEGLERQGVPALSVLRPNHEFRQESNELARFMDRQAQQNVDAGQFRSDAGWSIDDAGEGEAPTKSEGEEKPGLSR